MTLSARDIMTERADCVSDTETLRDAARHLSEADMNAVPVLGANGNAIGMLRPATIVQAVAEGRDTERETVADLMPARSVPAEPVTVEPDCPIEEVTRAMAARGAQQALVADNGTVLGVVTRVDLDTFSYRPPDGLPLPPPDLIELVTGPQRRQRLFHRFYESGARSADDIRRLLDRHGRAMEDFDSVLDFGCGCGRVMRQWHALERPRLHGADYNRELVAWCRRNLPFARYEQNRLESGLPFADGEFDLVYALSVFTHLDRDLQLPWMEELGRVARGGALILLTLLGESKLDTLDGEERSAFEAGELVIRRPQRSGKNDCVAFHPRRYIERTLARDFELMDFIPNGAPEMDQEALLLRKPERPPASDQR